MRAAVENIHHGDRQSDRLRPAEIPVKRLRLTQSGGFGRRKRHRKSGIRAERSFIFGSVKSYQGTVYRSLIQASSAKRGCNRAVYVFDGAEHALAAVALPISVAPLMRLVRARRCARRRGSRSALPGECADKSLPPSDFRVSLLSRVQNVFYSVSSFHFAPHLPYMRHIPKHYSIRNYYLSLF